MFMIVSPDDCQVFEMKARTFQDNISYLHELIGYASLDFVENKEWSENKMYISQVDKFNDFYVNCFITAGRMRFILIHKGYNDDLIKNFFNEVYENYVKTLLNPFIDKNTKILSSNFEEKIKNLMNKYFT